MPDNPLKELVEDPSEVDIPLFQAGDQAVFKKIFSRLVKTLSYYASGILQDPQLAEDKIAEVFYQLFHHRSELHNSAVISTYCFECLRGLLLEHIAENESMGLRDELVALPKDLWKDMIMKVERESLHRHQLWDLLLELPWQMALVVQLRVYNLLSDKEIGTKTGFPLTMVHEYKLRATELLKAKNMDEGWLSSRLAL